MTGSPIDSPNNYDADLAEVTNYDEAITAVYKSRNDMDIGLKEERKNKSYKEKMNIDI